MKSPLEFSPTMPAFGAREALQRLLSAYGVEQEAHPQEFMENDAQGALVIELERHGLLARWTRLDASDLASLQLPSLAARSEGGFWLLKSYQDGHLVAQGPHGEQHLKTTEAEVGTYLDLAPALPQGDLWACIRKQLMTQRKALGSIVIAALLLQLLGLLIPQCTRILVDHVFPQAARSLFLLVLMASAILAIYRAWAGWMQGRFELFLETRLGFVIEQGMMAHLLRLPYPWLSKRTVGDLLQGFSGIGAARQFLTGQLLTTMLSGCSSICYFVLMVKTLPYATLWVAGLALISVGATILVGRQVAALQTLATTAQVKERSFLVEMLQGVAVVKASGAETNVATKLMNLVRSRRRLDLASARINLSTVSLLDLVQTLLTQMLAVWGGYQVIQGRLHLGEMLAFIMMAGAFQQAIAQSGHLYLKMVRMKPQLAMAQVILATQTEPILAQGGQRELTGPIKIQNLHFRYLPTGPWVLENFSLTVAPGEKVVLRGPSGCGKSTLLKLVANLYAPERGTLTVGGAPPAQAKSVLAYLPQFVQLFNGSLHENLRLLSAGASRAALMAAAKTTGLSELVAALPMGYETLVSPGGGNFSGGQRQLIALTAVIASPRQVLLLDEAMANLDPLSKKRLFTSELFLGKTILLASHEELQGPLSPEQYGFRRVHLIA